MKRPRVHHVFTADLARPRRRANRMNRRNFITVLSGAAAAWPLAARAQQAERVRRIGVLSGLAENDPEGRSRIAAFRGGLQRLGWNAVAVTRANSAGIVGDGGTW
jgi:DNA-binding LacI/PurR family transcriptional regulator